MNKIISSAGLVYLYLNGYLKDGKIYIDVVDTYQYFGNAFYGRVIENDIFESEDKNIVHVFAVVGIKEKVNRIYSIIENNMINSFNNILNGEKLEKYNEFLDETGNFFNRSVQEFFCESVNHFPRHADYDFDDFILKGICCYDFENENGSSIVHEMVSLWVNREEPMLCGKQLMIKSFFMRDFIGRKLISTIPEFETGSWRLIFEGGHQLSMNPELGYLKETLHPDDIGVFCTSSLQSILMNPIYAYGQWFQPNDLCEEWHKVFLYICAISDCEWDESKISKIYDKFLDFLKTNICVIMEAEPLISKEDYYKILLIQIENFRKFLKGEDEEVISKDLLQTMDSRYVYLPYLDFLNLNKPHHKFPFLFLKEQISEAIKEKNIHKKGILWERVAESVLDIIEGFKITGKRIRTRNQEIDISIVNTSLDYELWQLGAYILVECKNWSSHVDLHQIRNIAYISNMKGNKTSILFAANGITSDAENEIYRLAVENCFIICITAKELLGIKTSKECKELILDKWYHLVESVKIYSRL